MAESMRPLMQPPHHQCGLGEVRRVVFMWSTKWGECQECGLPAAFYDTPYGNDQQRKLCAVCAANSAVDGETIRRIDPREGD